MRVLVIGGGGREHALTARLAQDRDVGELVVAPGNPGIAGLARTVPLDLARPEDALALADREQIDLTIVGPELPAQPGHRRSFRVRGAIAVRSDLSRGPAGIQ